MTTPTPKRGALAQFIGARVVNIAGDWGQLWIELQLPSDQTRDLTVDGLPSPARIAVRIDGMYVPPEEL